jgi:regulator of sirC expression with transglutaminase-like and TPR domain
VNRRALLLGLASLGCHARAAPNWSLARSLWRLSQKSGQVTGDGAWFWAELRRVAERVGSRHADGEPPATALTRVLFDDLGFTREVERTALEFVLLPGVLRARRGSCVGLGSLYLCLAQALAFRAQGVLRPGHFYVRHHAPGPACNVELLRRGEHMADTWYDWRFPLTQAGSRSYGRPLSELEVLGVAAFNVGNERRRHDQLDLAERAYQEAVAAFPSFAEAHASLGAAQQLLGKPRAAAQSYARALALDPTLPGVGKNLALLGRLAP